MERIYLFVWLLTDYKREYGAPSTRPEEDSDGIEEESGEDLPSSGALSIAPTSGPEVAFSLVFVLFSHLLVPVARR
jgi:hypothetical protein